MTRNWRFSRPRTQVTPPAPREGWRKVWYRVRRFFGTHRREILWTLVGGFVVMIVAGVTIVLLVTRDGLSLEQLSTRQVAQSTKIYDRTGTHLLYETYGDQKRTIIPLDRMATSAVQATIAVEDKLFYEHGGVRVPSILRAGFNNILGRLGWHRAGSGGASTLTQQLIKNALVGNESRGFAGYFRKIKEAILAVQLERHYTKDQILTMYLNEISYGSTNYGIEAASRSYFNKSAADLTIAESATLAAMLKQPSYYLRNPEAHKERRNLVLYLMAEQNFITQEQKTAAQAEPLVFEKAQGIPHAQHFVLYVKGLLDEQYGERVVDTSGFKVVTTLDYDKQIAAEAIVKENGDKFAKESNANNAALVALDPKTGEVLAMVGSRDFYNKEIDGQYNVIAQGQRQPGSSFKPFVYLAAFEKGYTPETVVYDVRTEFDLTGRRPFAPRNANGREYGLITFRSALQGSLNIPAVKAMYLVGYEETIDFAKRFGYTTFNGDLGLSLVLGGGVVSPLEHTAAYAALANGGKRLPPTSILSVENDQGEKLYEWRAGEPTEAVSEELATTITNVLADNNARAYIFGAKNNLVLPDRPAAAKTGTTQNYRDAWTLGYVPSLAAGVWVGNTDYTPMKAGQGGEKLAGLIWNQFMRQAVSGTPVEKFAVPATTTPPDKPVLRGADRGIKLKINTLTGRIAASTTPAHLVEERTYLPPHDILHYVVRTDPRGPAPADPTADPQYENWEKYLQEWVVRRQTAGETIVLTDPPSEVDMPQDPALIPSVDVVSPTAYQTFTARALNFQVNAAAPRGVSRVEYRIDGLLVGTSYNAPFSFNYYARDLSRGQHVLTVVAMDDLGNYVQKEVPFTLDVELDPPSVSWFGGNTVTLKNSDFPRAMYLTPFRFDDIKTVNIYLVAPGQEKKLIYTFLPDEKLFNNNLIFTWNHSPGPGDSTLIAETMTDGGLVTEQELSVRVTE